MPIPRHPTKVGDLVRCVAPIGNLREGVLYRITREAPWLYDQTAMLVVERAGEVVRGGPFWRWRFSDRAEQQ